jgi:hypothetical protein
MSQTNGWMLLKCSILAVKYNTKRALCLLSDKWWKEKARTPSAPLIFLNEGKMGKSHQSELKSLRSYYVVWVLQMNDSAKFYFDRADPLLHMNVNWATVIKSRNESMWIKYVLWTRPVILLLPTIYFTCQQRRVHAFTWSPCLLS